MADIIKINPPSHIASAFLASASRPPLPPDVWAEAGHAIEMAHRSPLPIGRTARLVFVLCLALMVQFFAR